MTRRLVTSALVLILGLTAFTHAQPRPPRIVIAKLFDDAYRQGGFDYTYPPSAKIEITKTGGYRSPAALKIDLDNNDYSGASICLYNEVFDLSKNLLDGALEFYIKGAKGGEQIKVGLLDEEISDNKKTQVILPLNPYVQITKKWQKVVIPLADFPERGLYWDQDKKVELPSYMDFDKVAEVRFSADKGVNAGGATIWVDNIEFVKGTVKKSKPKPKQTYWDEKVEVVNGPANPEKLDGIAKPLSTIYDNGVKGFSYVYGGKTAVVEQKSKTANNPNVLAMYIDDSDYSGVTLSIGQDKFLHLAKYRNTGGFYFWIKGGKGGESVLFGILDNQGNDIKSQTKVSLKDWVQISDKWQLVKIPLKRFADVGRAWDATKQAEVATKVQWNKVQEVRFSVNMGENKREGDPVTIYVDQLTFTENIDWVDPDLKWESFNSKAADVVLMDFENKPVWEPSHGPKSKLKMKVGPTKNLDKNALIIEEYLMNDWVDNVYDFKKQKSPAKLRDWSKHWAIMFDIYTEKAWQGITVQVGDSGGELFVANTGAPRGRHTVLIPFRDFVKFPYYQPPHAKQNGVFDLDNIEVLDFKPSGEGTTGSFEIDNVKLTNMRELPKKKVEAVKNVTITGDMKKVINPAISDAIYGINAALWDGDLLKPETEKLVKRINHGIIRYPGGLRADDDHWEEVLRNKDWMVDTDEFLDWCKRTETSPMFTVNFGSGTAEEAARWVQHTNIKRKANVRYWEIGNELYGDWHNHYEKWGKDNGITYGKRARDFIVKMKKVDPTIKVAVVGVLDGEWNDNVLKATHDVADAIIIHHYPQHYGEENNYALLASPQSLEGIFERINATAEKYSKDKKLEVWLTEWNSVDFNPGPQTLSLVNGIFVADYLGMLAKVGAGSAQYWDIHNDITPEGGDYGYLSRSYDEQIGGNQPRPSYYGFQLAADAIRGKLVESQSGEDNLTTYLSINGKRKGMMVINKNPDTDYKATMKIPGFKGKAKMQTMQAPKGEDPDKVIKIAEPPVQKITIKEGQSITFPKYSVTIIIID
ncbi:MAG: carbohydrate-binding protein [Fibrobacter sp.]|nr:carbohydrate-binding protein [Fibrobacter sp.]